MNERIDQRIIRITLSRRTSNESEIRASVAPELTVQIIRNCLLETELRSRVPLTSDSSSPLETTSLELATREQNR